MRITHLISKMPSPGEDKECEAAPDEGPGAVSAAGWMGMAGVGSSGGIGWSCSRSKIGAVNREKV